MLLLETLCYSKWSSFHGRSYKKVIMKRSQLRKVFLQRKHSIVKLHIVNKRTTVPASSCKKNETFENIGTSNISDNKLFWKTVQPMFSNKSVNRESITLVKGDKISSENLEVAETFNAFFSNIVKKMNISLGQELLIERIISRIQFQELWRD